MNWLKDKKNQPIIIITAICTVVVIVGALLYFFVFKGSPAPDVSAQAPPDASAPGVAPGAPPANPAPGAAPDPNAGAVPGGPAPAAAPTGTPGAPGAPGGAPTSGGATPAAGAKVAQVAALTPMETWRNDPFQPIGYKKPPKVKQNPPIRDFPFEKIDLPGIHIGQNGKNKEIPELPQPPRRMAGILLNQRVYAIIETNGVSDVVQPGDMLKDHLASVERIEPDKIILKTVDKKPRYITVKMAASPHVDNSSAASAGAPLGMAPYPQPGPRMPIVRPPANRPMMGMP